MTTYSEKIQDHFENPRHAGAFDKSTPCVGTGTAGSPEIGQVTRLQIQVTPQGKIEEARFKTYGCPAAIASSSLAAEWITGKTLEEALALTTTEIARELALPAAKIHCAILAEDALKAAIADYRQHHGKEK
ncbi:MAG: iron-sulfur cluster assembly scaffold protein [Alistipes senegalensis]|nr:iron-sulfur cluster assembly scaffold protein [Oxalobacter formigenes]MCM1281740.1 iron-sulfur cluster assembly scaffold protein [Alistipes senegalensis]